MSEEQDPSQYESRETTDALDDSGYVLMLANTGKVALCTAGSPAYGVAIADTKNKVTGVAAANKQVGILKKGAKAKVQYNVASTDPDVAIGDYVSVKGANASGTVKKHVGTAVPAAYAQADFQAIHDEKEMIVGIALEALTAPGAGSITGKLSVQLTCPNFGRQE